MQGSRPIVRIRVEFVGGLILTCIVVIGQRNYSIMGQCVRDAAGQINHLQLLQTVIHRQFCCFVFLIQSYTKMQLLQKRLNSVLCLFIMVMYCRMLSKEELLNRSTYTVMAYSSSNKRFVRACVRARARGILPVRQIGAFCKCKNVIRNSTEFHRRNLSELFQDSLYTKDNICKQFLVQNMFSPHRRKFTTCLCVAHEDAVICQSLNVSLRVFALTLVV